MRRQISQGVYSPISVEDSIEIVKKIYLLFVQNKIKVIRIGLQGDAQEINENESVIAGPFHPAFGELVFQDYTGITWKLFDWYKIQESIIVQVNKSLVSQLVGNKKRKY